MTDTPAVPEAPAAPAAPAAPDLDLAGLVEIFVHLSEKSRRQGLLSLEDEMAGLPSDDLREALMEVVDGSPPDIITQVLDLRMEALRERREAELRRELTYHRLIKTGVLAVQRGHPPRLVRTLLAAQLPPEDRARVAKPLTAGKFSPPSTRVRWPSADPAPGWTAEDANDLTLDSVIKLSQRDMQRLTRNIHHKDLCLALRGVSDEVRDRFLASMSARAANQVREEVALMGPQRVTIIDEAKQRIVAIMRGLHQVHEIGAPEKRA